MLSISTKGAIDKLRKQEKRYKMGITVRYQKLVFKMFKDVVEHTPQWSGNLASNWVIEVGSVGEGQGGYRQLPSYAGVNWKGTAAKQAGHSDAVAIAISYAEGSDRIGSIRWNSRVSIANHTPYAAQVEQDKAPDGRDIREENKFTIPYVNSYGIAMAEYLKAKYSAQGFLKV
jgi:hypothetical protein